MTSFWWWQHFYHGSTNIQQLSIIFDYFIVSTNSDTNNNTSKNYYTLPPRDILVRKFLNHFEIHLSILDCFARNKASTQLQLVTALHPEVLQDLSSQSERRWFAHQMFAEKLSTETTSTLVALGFESIDQLVSSFDLRKRWWTSLCHISNSSSSSSTSHCLLEKLLSDIHISYTICEFLTSVDLARLGSCSHSFLSSLPMADLEKVVGDIKRWLRDRVRNARQNLILDAMLQQQQPLETFERDWFLSVCNGFRDFSAQVVGLFQKYEHRALVNNVNYDGLLYINGNYMSNTVQQQQQQQHHLVSTSSSSKTGIKLTTTNSTAAITSTTTTSKPSNKKYFGRFQVDDPS
jgi:hypothetical protein